MHLDTFVISFFYIVAVMEPSSQRPKAKAKKGEWPKASERTFRSHPVETHQDDWEAAFIPAALRMGLMDQRAWWWLDKGPSPKSVA